MTDIDQSLEFDSALISKYDQAGPRYTSYPTAPQFHADFKVDDYRSAALASNSTSRTLSLYFHIPFCDTICFYCACNKIATKDRSLGTAYIDRLCREIALQSDLFASERQVEQLHWGGGTPTFLSQDEMRKLMRVTREQFNLVDDKAGEFAIEIDPREANAETIQMLREIGFNRLSLGVQDFDPKVQKAVNRIQTEDETMAVIESAREYGFRSVSIDLIYGLPLQSAKSFSQTLERVIEAAPDRISVFNYAHLPNLFKPQRRINPQELPSPKEKLAILSRTIDKLLAAGYLYIGMDHFAHPNDELAKAQREGTLYRNFQGYSTHADSDLIAMGITSISMIGTTYSQNVRTLEAYYNQVDAGQLPLLRGFELSTDDLIRRDVITQLICHFRLQYKAVEDRWNFLFGEYFADDLQKLKVMQEDGLLEMNDREIRILPRGRLLIRNICMAFDTYLPPAKQQNSFSKVI